MCQDEGLIASSAYLAEWHGKLSSFLCFALSNLPQGMEEKEGH